MLAGLLLFVVSAMAQEKVAASQKPATTEKAVHKFVGSAKCKMCHNSPAKGDQFKIWSESKHAKAMEALATPKADSIAKAMGIAKATESDKCLGCHVTGYSAPASAKAATFTPTEGVGCEACHGAGSDFMAMSVMKDKAAALAAGLVMPDQKTCIVCHNDKSPTYKTFVYADFYKKIAHNKPVATK